MWKASVTIRTNEGIKKLELQAEEGLYDLWCLIEDVAEERDIIEVHITRNER